MVKNSASPKRPFFLFYEFYYENDSVMIILSIFCAKNQSVTITMMVSHFDLKKLLHVVTM